MKQIAAVCLCGLLLMGEPAYAGSLNANEQELMGIIRGTYTYKGVTYKVRDKYIQMAADYLAQDGLDTTDEQKQKAINKMYSSIQQGIDEGYLEPAGEDAPGIGSGSKGGAIQDGGEGSQTDSPEDSRAGSGGNEGEAETGNVADAAGTEAGSKAGAAGTAAGDAADALGKSLEVSALERYADSGNDFQIPAERDEKEFLHIPDFPWKMVMGVLAAVTSGGGISITAAVRTKLFIHQKKRKRGILL